MKEILAQLDAEIAALEKVKTLLVGVGAKTATAFAFGANKPRKKHVMSAAAKAKIRAAQKARWAEWHKTHPKKAK